MKTYEIIFSNKNEHIKIILSQPLDYIFRYDEVTILFHSRDGADYIIYEKDFIIEALRLLYYSLESLLNGKRKLHESITKNIGYLWNKYLYGTDKSFVYKKWSDGTTRWIGLDYSLLSSLKAKAWLYEREGTLYLEVTPAYNWPSAEEKKQGYPTYREFLKNYKPYVVTTLDREVAHDWYKKAGELLVIVEANDAKHRDMLDAMPVFIKADEQEN